MRNNFVNIQESEMMHIMEMTKGITPNIPVIVHVVKYVNGTARRYGGDTI